MTNRCGYRRHDGGQRDSVESGLQAAHGGDGGNAGLEWSQLGTGGGDSPYGGMQGRLCYPRQLPSQEGFVPSFFASSTHTHTNTHTGADVNTVGTNGDSALTCASEGGHKQVVLMLLQAGAIVVRISC